MTTPRINPIEALANARHEFGEHGGVNMSIEASTTFTVMEANTMPAVFQGEHGPDQGGCYLYGRHYNPTVYALGKQLAALEGSESAYCTASGLGAISSAVLQMCNTGDHIVSSDTIYGGTFALFHDFFPAKMGINTSFIDMSDLDAVDQAFTSKTKVLYIETMSNPTLRVADIPALAEIAHKHGAQLIVDNTFCPLMVSPLALGADVVVHSLTKYINGASDSIAGAICGSNEFIGSLMDLHLGSLMLLGPTMDPRIASNISMRVPHLGLRMTEHSRRALYFAQKLEAMGLDVSYPGLESHQDHALFGKISNEPYGAGGIFTIDVGSAELGNKLIDTLQNECNFGFMAVSLGFFDTLLSCSASSTSSELSDEDLERAGIKPGLVRIALGYTGTIDQRWEQMERALSITGISGS
ncbi:MAG: aminotransferase class I/II-fold pyridoxal phosphate-dependent enzyme [Phycisphaerales bacterium]